MRKIIALLIFVILMMIGCGGDSYVSPDIANGGVGNSPIANTVGNLVVAFDKTSPTESHLVMGDVEQDLAVFNFSAADSTENIAIERIVLTDVTSGLNQSSLKIIKLYDGNTQIGAAFPSPAAISEIHASGGGSVNHSHIDFNGLSLTIPAGGSKVLAVKADIATADEGAVSGAIHEIIIAPTYDGINDPITAFGASSGALITGDNLDIGGENDRYVAGNLMTIVRTKPIVSWAADTPSGPSIPSAEQVVAKVNITAQENIGNFSVIIKAANLIKAVSLSDDGFSYATADDGLKIYLGPTLLISVDFNRRIEDADFPDITIPSGTTATFTFTIDTSSFTNGDMLRVAPYDITWGDNSGTVFTAVDSLPLEAITLIY